MGCIDPDGTVTVAARAVLRALASGGTAEDVARAAAMPLYRVRASLRELVAAGLVIEASGQYTLTGSGQRAVA